MKKDEAIWLRFYRKLSFYNGLDTPKIIKAIPTDIDVQVNILFDLDDLPVLTA